MTGTDGVQYNFGIKAGDSSDFIYPESDVLTAQMEKTFTKNVTSEFISWFMTGLIL